MAGRVRFTKLPVNVVLKLIIGVPLLKIVKTHTNNSINIPKPRQ